MKELKTSPVSRYPTVNSATSHVNCVNPEMNKSTGKFFIYLPTFLDSKSQDFKKDFQRLSEDFRGCSEDFQRCPKHF